MLTKSNFPDRSCFHSNCPGHNKKFGLGGKHGICREIINHPDVCCGHKIHSLILNILDHGTERFKLDQSSFFTERARNMVKDIMAVLQIAFDGHPISDIAGWCAITDDIPEDFAKMLSMNIAIDATHGFVFSKYHRSNIQGTALTTPKEILEYLKQHIGKQTHSEFVHMIIFS